MIKILIILGIITLILSCCIKYYNDDNWKRILQKGGKILKKYCYVIPIILFIIALFMQFINKNGIKIKRNYTEYINQIKIKKARVKELNELAQNLENYKPIVLWKRETEEEKEKRETEEIKRNKQIRKAEKKLKAQRRRENVYERDIMAKTKKNRTVPLFSEQPTPEEIKRHNEREQKRRKEAIIKAEQLRQEEWKKRQKLFNDHEFLNSFGNPEQPSAKKPKVDIIDKNAAKHLTIFVCFRLISVSYMAIIIKFLL